MTDLIDTLAGIAPGSLLDAVRARRPAARLHAEASHRSLLQPEEPGDVSRAERFAVATYVSGLHQAPEASAHYAAGLREQGGTALAEAVARAAAETLAEGPAGAFPPGPLSVEDMPAPGFALSDPVAAALGPRLATAFAHAHMLVFHPRDARAESVAPLQAAGGTVDGLVTLSQLVAFLTFPSRTAAGLRVLAATS